MRPGSPLPYAVKREEWNLNYLRPGTVVEGRNGRRWVKSGRGLLPICRTCGAPISHRSHYCAEHRPRPSPNGLGGSTRAESARRREEVLSRLVAILREDPEATSHRLRLAFPFQTVSEALIAEARRMVRQPPPVATAPEEAVTA